MALECWDFEPAICGKRVQPSLRDLMGNGSIPGSELPGYFQLSLRDSRTSAWQLELESAKHTVSLVRK
jgi:hypothetical protein